MSAASVGSAKFSLLNFFSEGCNISTKRLIIFRTVPWDFKKGLSSSIWTYFDDYFYSNMYYLSPHRNHRRHSSTDPFLQKSWDLQLGNGTALWNSVSTFICLASCSRSCWAPLLWALCAGKPVSELGLSLANMGTSKFLAGVPWAGPVLERGQAPSASGTCCAQSLLTRWILGWHLAS